MLTEAKGRKVRRGLAPKPHRAQPAELVKDSYLQLTGGGYAQLAAGTRLFLCVTSPIDSGLAVDLEVAEYVKGPPHGCDRCRLDLPFNDEDFRRHEPILPEQVLNAIRPSWYQGFWSLVGGTEADVDEAGDYFVLDLVDADVTIGLHRRIAEFVSRSDENLDRELSGILESLPRDLADADDGRYPDGTLFRTDWPEMESADEEERDGFL